MNTEDGWLVLFVCVSICLFLSATFQTYENWIESWIYHAMKISNTLCLSMEREICLACFALVLTFLKWDLPVSDGNDLCLLFALLDITFFCCRCRCYCWCYCCWWYFGCYCYWCVSSNQLNSTYNTETYVCILNSEENDCNTYIYFSIESEKEFNQD